MIHVLYVTFIPASHQEFFFDVPKFVFHLLLLPFLLQVYAAYQQTQYTVWHVQLTVPRQSREYMISRIGPLRSPCHYG